MSIIEIADAVWFVLHWPIITMPFGYCPSTAFLPVWLHCANARWNRCQDNLNSFPLGELEETTRMPSYYMDEDYPARPKI